MLRAPYDESMPSISSAQAAEARAEAAHSARRRILVVDDEPMVREVVTRYLQRENFAVDTATDGREALVVFGASRPDLVILDVMLPEMDGLGVLERLRARGDVPVILLTARTEEDDRVVGLELGADDYVINPFSPRELVARVKSVLRRVEPSTAASRLEFEGLTIDVAAREVLVRNALVKTTPKEFDLLAFMASSPRQAFSRGQLLEHVWGSSTDVQGPSTVTVHVRRVRNAIEVDPQHPRWILTVSGVGYRFEP